ncbi:SDR family NAD(P)-dependent oxidoreductase (plasmid) [Deinococcus sp. KNUC1210]|uniref:SDR family NAD(P)-dependent oxidoreductase n=1 Tax=Deinococcus sp. KNUC1210 TaxID=2917691 RepID=UPI001EF1282F|nr:SDR family NAD(P)-dependent oxidoreductase [Deinococcus sp. KNUC1210]ULH17693.1 SDR family NAD(P)-dependent oxidoreductase [Deinococcus sp. KNUC1210]
MSDDLTPQDWDTARRVLQAVLRDPALAESQPAFSTLVAGVNRLGRKHARQQERLTRPPVPSSRDLPTCYICKARYAQPHTSNPSLCPTCGAFNAEKRHGRTDLHGRVAVLTGGRVKIGYETALKLLRDGARVIVTTRFPQDAARRYAQEPDVAAWQAQLTLYGLDLRDLHGVQRFIDHLNAHERHLDILINNAAQTISRPAAFYAHLLAGERHALPGTAGIQLRHPAPLALLDNAQPTPDLSPYFPAGELDADGQQLDLRSENSWSAQLAQVSTRELLEVQLVNAAAPFLLCAGLKSLLLASPFERRFIVNVSAMEGQFTRRSKTDRHPHTNMAKAALNMLTRTSGPDLAGSSIYMTSVDTGWVTNENPHPKAERMAGLGFVPPLDVIDGASRIYDPVVSGLNEAGKPLFGVFLKDYRPYPW